VYTLTAHGDGARSMRIAVCGLAVLTVGWVLTADLADPERVGWLFFRIGTAIMATTLGESVRARRVVAVQAQELAAQAHERAERAERSKEEEARRRVDAERLRIAREVHDTVAHAIAIINVQAGVTAHVLDKRPERARDTLRTIEQTSARALRELRSTLQMLTDTDGRGDDRSPTPGLGHLEELAGRARQAGLEVTVETLGTGPELPSALDSAAYRILQESLTNVIRHAGPSHVRIAIRYSQEALGITVTDDGPGTTAPLETTAGRGIAGMRERCELLGGRLTAGPCRQGGFQVVATLPLRPELVPAA
jgi:signal transduction histidine kinase